MDEEKKAEKKRKRFAARLKMSKGIVCSEVPGPVSSLQNIVQLTKYEPN